MTTPRTPVPPSPATTPDATAPAAAVGAGSATPLVSPDPKSEVPGTVELVAVAAPGSADFDTATSDVAALEAHVRILTARKQLADLSTSTAAPAAFTAPSAPLVAKHDSATNLVQHLPQKLWDVLSEEDQARFSPAGAKKPADLPQA